MSTYYTDPNLILSDSQAITATADSTNVIDRQSTPTLQNLGIIPMFLEVHITEAFDALTSLTVALKSDSTTNLDTSETVHITEVIALAALTVGAKFKYRLPYGNYERYLGIEYTVTGTGPSVGKVFAALVPSADFRTFYPDGRTIS